MENLAALTGNPIHAAVALDANAMDAIRAAVAAELVEETKVLRRHLLNIHRATEGLPGGSTEPKANTAEIVDAMVERIRAAAQQARSEMRWYKYTFKGISLGGEAVILAKTPEQAKAWAEEAAPYGAEHGGVRLDASGPIEEGTIHSYNGDY